MAEFPKSQLPQDPGYWEELAQRIRRDASAPLAAYAAAQQAWAAQDSWYDVLARRSAWLVAPSAAAVLILWLALPAADSSVALRWIERSVAPTEMAGTLLGGPQPPSVEALVVQFSPPLEDGGQH